LVSVYIVTGLKAHPGEADVAPGVAAAINRVID
jgi:hypothetical protein